VLAETHHKETVIVRKTFLSALALAFLLGGAARLPAQELKPVAVASIASYDEIVSNLNLVGQMTGMPTLSQGFEGVVAMATQGQGLKGLDKTKPIGVAVFLDASQTPKALIFLGATDAKALIGGLPMLQAQEKDGGWEVPSPQGPVTMMAKGGWLFASNDADLVKTPPTDPQKILNGLDKKYAVALQINVQNVPEALRSALVEAFKANVNAALRQKAGEEESSFEMRKKLAESQVHALETGIKEINDLTVGLGIDAKTRTTHLDISLTALPGSEIAKKIAGQADGKSEFTGFLLPDAAMSFNALSQFSQSDAEQSLAVIKGFRAKTLAQADNDPNLADENVRKAAKEVLNDLFDVVDDTIKAGKMDVGAAIVLAPNSLSAAAGGFVANGPDLEKAIKKLVELGKSDPNFPPVKFDVETHKGVRMHSITIPMTDEGGKHLFGDSLDVYLGIGEKSAYLAFGKDSLGLLKSILDKGPASDSVTPMPPVQLNVALSPIMQFASSMNPGDQSVQMISTLLASSQGKDHIRLTAHTIENGVLYRLAVEEGVLKIIGPLAMSGHGPAARRPRGAGNAPGNPAP
jgi:hypothetical protein